MAPVNASMASRKRTSPFHLWPILVTRGHILGPHRALPKVLDLARNGFAVGKRLE